MSVDEAMVVKEAIGLNEYPLNQILANVGGTGITPVSFRTLQNQELADDAIILENIKVATELELLRYNLDPTHGRDGFYSTQFISQLLNKANLGDRKYPTFSCKLLYGDPFKLRRLYI